MTDRANYTSGGYRGGGPAGQMRPPQKIPSASLRRHTVTETKKTRTVKDPAQRAQEALDVAQRRVAKLRAKADAAEQERDDAMAALVDAEEEVAYLAGAPALKKTPTAGYRDQPVEAEILDD